MKKLLMFSLLCAIWATEHAKRAAQVPDHELSSWKRLSKLCPQYKYACVKKYLNKKHDWNLAINLANLPEIGPRFGTNPFLIRVRYTGQDNMLGMRRALRYHFKTDAAPDTDEKAEFETSPEDDAVWVHPIR